MLLKCAKIFKNFRYWLLLIVVLQVFFITVNKSIASNGTITIYGRAIHAITGLPMRNFPVVAETGITDKDDLRFKKAISKTRSDGSFSISGLSPRHGYVVTVVADGFESDSAYVMAPTGEKEATLEKPLKVCSVPRSKGIFVWETNGWKLLSNNTSLKVKIHTIWGRLNMTSRSYLFYYYPTSVGTRPTLRIQVSGFPNHIVSLDNVYKLTRPIILAVRGKEYLSHRIMPLYFLPKIALTACPQNPDKCGALEFPEGYYLGLSDLSAISGQKSLLLSLYKGPMNYTDLSVKIEGTPLHELCKQKVSGYNNFVYCYIDLKGASQFSIVPKTNFGPTQIYMRSEGKLIPRKSAQAELNKLISRGIEAITVVPTFNGANGYSDTQSLSLTTKCDEDPWNMRLGIYYRLIRPAIQLDMDILYSGIEGEIDRNKFYSNLLSLSNGLLLLNSIDSAKTSSDFVAASLSSLGLASKVYEVNNYIPILASSLSASIKAVANPTPESIALHVASSTLSSINNFISSAKINNKRKKFETLMGIRNTLDAYYLGCGRFDYVENILNVTLHNTECNYNALTCISMLYLQSLGFQNDHEKITSVINSVLGQVNDIYRAVSN